MFMKTGYHSVLHLNQWNNTDMLNNLIITWIKEIQIKNVDFYGKMCDNNLII
jgi:hypothetical protein